MNFKLVRAHEKIETNKSGWFCLDFLPPPPRPPFLPELATVTDGLTSCDLCSWSTGEKKGYYTVEGHAGNKFISIRSYRHSYLNFFRIIKPFMDSFNDM